MKNDEKYSNENQKEKNKNPKANYRVNNGYRARKTRAVFSWALALIIIGLFGAMLYIGSNKQTEQISQLKTEKTELKLELSDRDQLIDDMVTTFNEIETDLQEITKKESAIEVQTGDVEQTKSKKDRIVDEIKYVNSLLEENKQKINYLNRRLKNSGVKIASLEEKVQQLEQSVLARDSSMKALAHMLEKKNYQIVQLNDKMDTMQQVIQKQKEVIDFQNEETNTAYLTTGNYDELEKQGIITTEKGFLFFGKEKVIQKDFSNESFREVKISETKRIPVKGKKAEIITNHPKNSYVFVKDSTQGLAYLEIKDPGAFWKVSRYAVIETK